MVDTKLVLDMLMGAASRNQPAGGGGLGGMLGSLLGGGQQQGQQQQQGGGLGDLLGAVLGGGQQAAGQAQRTAQQGAGGLGDLLGQVMGGAQQHAGQAANQAQQHGGGLGDLLGSVLGGAQQQAGNVAGKVQQTAQQGAGGLGDILGSLLGGAQQQSGQVVGQAQQHGGGLGDLLSSVLGGGQQAQAPAQPSTGGLGGMLGNVLGGGAGNLGQLGSIGGLGAILSQLQNSANPQEILAKISAINPQAGELLGKLKDVVGENQLGAGAVAGGLGGLLLGSSAARGVAAQAIKLGGLAMIGALAYNAFNNWQNGKPAGSVGQLLEAPKASGFNDEDGDPQNQALLMLRAMVASASADGVIDAQERKAIFGNLQNSGLGQEGADFLAQELANPVDVNELAQYVDGAETALKVYTAARLAIDPDTEHEQAFLAALAEQLGINAELVAHIDANAVAVKNSHA